jgi:hypothetical protein
MGVLFREQPFVGVELLLRQQQRLLARFSRKDVTDVVASR